MLCIPDFYPKLWEKELPCTGAEDLKLFPAALWIKVCHKWNLWNFWIQAVEIGWNAAPEGEKNKIKVFCGQSPFSKLVGFSAGVPGVKISVQGMEKFLNSLNHVEFNMDILDLAAQVSLAGVEMSTTRGLGTILSWGDCVDIIGIIFCLNRNSCYLWVVSSEVVNDHLILISLLP